MSSSEITPEIFLDANMNAARAMGGEDNFSELAKTPAFLLPFSSKLTDCNEIKLEAPLYLRGRRVEYAVEIEMAYSRIGC
jgi:hypothetical protein